MELKEVINYKEYVEFMESKKVRHGKDRTYTLYDFATEEQENEIRRKGITNLSFLDPTPKDIQKHFDFIDITYNYLRQKYPKDEYLKSLANEEDMQIERYSMNWYTKYGIDK